MIFLLGFFPIIYWKRGCVGKNAFLSFHSIPPSGFMEQWIDILETELELLGGEPKQIRNILDDLTYVKNRLRQCRVCDISVPDVAAVLINSYGISMYTGFPYWMILCCLCILGILVHRVLGIRTQTDRWLFPDPPVVP